MQTFNSRNRFSINLRNITTSRREVLGVTLIELMIAFLVFGLCLVPIFDLFSKSRQITQFSEDDFLATNLAMELLDQVDCMPFEGIPPMGGRPIKNEENGYRLLESQPSTFLSLSPLPAGFERYLTVEPLSDFLKKITVKIAFGKNPPRELELSTFTAWRP